MRFRRLTQLCAAAALALAGTAVQAHPGSGPHDNAKGPPMPGAHHPAADWRGGRAGPPYGPTAAERAEWIDECQARTSDDFEDDRWYRRSRRDSDARGERERLRCETYYDDYYAYYARQTPAYRPSGHGHMHMPASADCCAPPPATRPECAETVEYEYVDVPARRVIRRAPRPAPDKRIRLVPDKRVGTS
jgi:hypothetical protein